METHIAHLEGELKATKALASQTNQENKAKIKRLEKELHAAKESLRRQAAELRETKEELKQTRVELHQTKKELQLTQDKLQSTQVELAQKVDIIATYLHKQKAEKEEMEKKVEQLDRILLRQVAADAELKLIAGHSKSIGLDASRVSGFHEYRALLDENGKDYREFKSYVSKLLGASFSLVNSTIRDLRTQARPIAHPTIQLDSESRNRALALCKFKVEQSIVDYFFTSS